MKTSYSILMFIFLLVNLLYSQPWVYDFGTSTGNIPANTVSETFLPTPASGTARVRVGNTGGSINLDNPGLTRIGTDSELRIVGPTSSSSGNKFSIYGYSASDVFYTQYDVCFGGITGGTVNSGTFYFFQGSGNTFSTSNNYTSTDVFSGIQWVLSSSGIITTAFLNGSGWISMGTIMFAQTNVYTVEIYGNNMMKATNYDRDGLSYTINAYTQDIWVNGSLVGDNIAKGSLANDANIDSFCFLSFSSSSNSANCFVDDMIYSNVLPKTETLPVELSSFTATLGAYGKIELNWVTQSETNAYGFYVLRAAENPINAANIVSPLIGATNTSSQQLYQFIDESVWQSGVYYYWLQSCDLDGSSYHHGPVSCLFEPDTDPQAPNIPFADGISGIYPNPFNPSTTISYRINQAGDMQMNIYNLRGQIVRSWLERDLTPNPHCIIWNGVDQQGKDCPSGIYWVEMKYGLQRFIRKVVLVK